MEPTTIGFVFATLLSTGASVASNIKSSQIASDNARMQKAQADRQAAIAKAKLKRENRIKQAQQLALGGSYGTSTSVGAVAGLEAGTTAAINDLNSQTDLQKQQYDLVASSKQKQNTINSVSQVADAGVNIFKNVDFTSGLDSVPDTSIASDWNTIPADTLYDGSIG